MTEPDRTDEKNEVEVAVMECETSRGVRGILTLGAFAGMTALAACDPCSGVSSCTVAPRVSVQGRIVDVVTGRSVPGTRVDIVRAGTGDSNSVVTDGYGLYQLELPGDAGSGTFDMVVSPPDKSPYRVRGLTLSTSMVHGDGNVLGAWVSQPYYALALELFFRGGVNDRIVNVTATFRRTGGGELTGPGWQNNEYRSKVDSFGRYSMFNNTVFSLGGEETVGDLYVNLPPPRGVTVVRGLRLTREHVYGAPVRLMQVDAGPSSAYIGRFASRATGLPVSGVRVSFKQTGGIPIGNPNFTAVSNDGGEFVFQLYPRAVGTIIGDLTIRPPAPDTGFVVSGIRLDTFDGEGVRFFRQWGVGLHLPWLGIVHAKGTGIANVEVEARRVGGIQATPSVLTVRSDENGFFPLYGFAPANTAGNLIVDLTFRPPAPYQSFVIRNVALATFSVDSDGRFVGLWDVDQPHAASSARSEPRIQR
jgi:hypothetical protein